MSNDHGPKNPSLLANTVALIGLIILAVIVIWGLLHLGSLSSTWLTSLFPGSSTSISISAPKSTTADTAFDLTWKYKAPTAGSYAVVYQCVTGATLSRVTASNALAAIPCGAAYTLGDATSSIALVPQLNATTTASIPLSIVFMPSTTDGKQARGSATIGIYTPAMPTPVVTDITPAPTPTTPTPAPTYTPPASTGTTYTSPADLAVRIVNVSTGNPASVTFDIANVGGTPTGTYYFTANLPTEDGYTYSSSAQASLNPGDHITNTLSFSPVAAAGGYIMIHVGESAGANNYAQQWVSGTGYAPSSYYDSYNYDTIYQNTYPAYNYNQTYQQPVTYGPNPGYPTYYPQYPYDQGYGYGQDYVYPYQY